MAVDMGALTGDLAATDPVCGKVADRSVLEEAVRQTGAAVGAAIAGA